MSNHTVTACEAAQFQSWCNCYQCNEDNDGGVWSCSDPVDSGSFVKDNGEDTGKAPDYAPGMVPIV